MGVIKDLKELIRGLGIAGKHLGRHAVTIQYPEQKWTMPERSRGVVVLLSDKETGELNCTGCMLCMRACPTAAIRIEAPRGEDKKRHLEKFVVDNTLCCYCGLCEEACNFCAIKMASIYYEMSTLDKADLIWDKDKLQEMGKPIDYVDTRKKKKPVEKKPVAKPAADAEVKDEAKPAPAEASANPAPEAPAAENKTVEPDKAAKDDDDKKSETGGEEK